MELPAKDKRKPVLSGKSQPSPFCVFKVYHNLENMALAISHPDVATNLQTLIWCVYCCFRSPDISFCCCDKQQLSDFFMLSVSEKFNTTWYAYPSDVVGRGLIGRSRHQLHYGKRSGMYVLFVAKSSPPSSSPSLSCCRLCLPSNGTSSSSNITVNWYHPAPKTFCWTIPYTKYPTIPLTNNRMGTNHTLEVPVVDLEANTNME